MSIKYSSCTCKWTCPYSWYSSWQLCVAPRVWRLFKTFIRSFRVPYTLSSCFASTVNGTKTVLQYYCQQSYWYTALHNSDSVTVTYMNPQSLLQIQVNTGTFWSTKEHRLRIRILRIVKFIKIHEFFLWILKRQWIFKKIKFAVMFITWDWKTSVTCKPTN